MVKPTSPSAAAAAERGYKAVQLRAKRLTFDQIADELGYASRSGAIKAYRLGLESMRRETPDTAALRVAESEYLDNLRDKIAGMANIGLLDAVGMGVRISERYSKLNGLDLNESRVAGALEAGAVANLMASSNLHAGIIAAMGKIGMPLEQQDRLIAAINEWLESQQQEESEPDGPAEMLVIPGEVEQ